MVIKDSKNVTNGVRVAMNKQVTVPEIVRLNADERLDILADILMEIIFEEGEDATTTK
jgi:hypothetical protein